MAVQSFAYAPQPALVSRAAGPGAVTSYLLFTPTGAAGWTDDPQAAVTFASMREATRAAMRLPSWVKAYSLPLETEIAFSRAH